MKAVSAGDTGLNHFAEGADGSTRLGALDRASVTHAVDRVVARPHDKENRYCLSTYLGKVGIVGNTALNITKLTKKRSGAELLNSTVATLFRTCLFYHEEDTFMVTKV